MSQPEVATVRKGPKKNPDVPARRSYRINGQIKPSPALLAAKQKAQAKQMMKKQTGDVFVRDIYQTMRDAKEMVRGPTGLVYDNRMVEHRCLWDPNYQECPERYTRVMERCRELGLLDRCKTIQPREATENEVLPLHTQEHIDILKATEVCQDINMLESISSQYDGIYIHPMTYKLSLLSVGSTIELINEVVKGNVQNGMAIIRPPGHHAMKSEFCGYCYFNNVALAADHALNNLGINRILIVDWDVHHGQATQQMFYSDPRVLYFSIHRYELGTFWPNLRESDFDYIGEGGGRGFNFNIPLNTTGMSNVDYMAIFHQVLLPVAAEFQPELIIVSSGYDAAVGCPEGEMEVTPACYSHLLTSLLGLANGKVAVVLEGGYFLKSLAEGAALTLRTLLGDPCPNIEALAAPSQSIQESILNTIYSHRDYWKCFQFHDTYSLESLQSENRLVDCSTQHLPLVIYNHNKPKPTVHMTRECYPIRTKEILAHFDNWLNTLIAGTRLLSPMHKLCLVYDPRMMQHKNAFDESHPEKPERIFSIFERHKEYGLLDRVHMLQSRIATEEELMLVHSAEYIAKIKALAELPESVSSDRKEWEKATKELPSASSVYFHPKSYSSAQLAAGSLLQVVDSVMKGESGSGLAIIRPPGHHAELSTPCGFCIFNNVSLAAKYALTKYGLNRILVVDWDIHHGNGTQHIFEEDPRVLFISLHRYDNGYFFPGSTAAAHTEVGSGPGRGFNVNIPWNKKGMGPAEYVSAFHRLVLPIAYQFNPELILVSAGFDAAIGDPLGGFKLSPETYGHLTHWLSPLAGGRIILTLEGGYNIPSISFAMTACTKALLGDPLPYLEAGTGPCPSAVTTIKEVIQVQKEFWSGLCFNKSLPEENILGSRSDIGQSEQEQSAVAAVKGEEEQGEGGPSSTPPFYGVNATDDMKLEKLCTTKPNASDEEVDGLLADSVAGLSLTDVGNAGPVVQHHGAGDNPGSQKETWPTDTPSGSSSSHDGGAAGGGGGGGQQPQSLVDYLSDNMQLLVTEQMFAVVPLPSCPHLPEVRQVPATGIDTNAPCVECNSTQENWTCLTCYSVHCGRFINGHMVEHGENDAHPLTLSFSDLSVWCYACEAYIDNPALYPAKNSAHISKFGSELAWSYSAPRPR